MFQATRCLGLSSKHSTRKCQHFRATRLFQVSSSGQHGDPVFGVCLKCVSFGHLEHGWFILICTRSLLLQWHVQICFGHSLNSNAEYGEEHFWRCKRNSVFCIFLGCPAASFLLPSCVEPKWSSFPRPKIWFGIQEVFWKTAIHQGIRKWHKPFTCKFHHGNLR